MVVGQLVVGGRETAHWAVTHGLPRVLIRRVADRGDLQARLIAASDGSGEDLFELIEQIRGEGPVHTSRIARITADHAVVREVLTSNDFRTGIPGRTGLLGSVGAWLRPDVLHPVEPPSLLVTEPPDHTRYRKLVMRVFTMRAVERLRSRTQQIADDLLDTLKAHKDDCVGMAANMIGVRKNIIAFLDESGKKPTYTVLFNLEILKAEGEFETSEGCLSLLGGPRPTRRFQKIKVRYQNEAMEWRIKTYSGWTAQIIQHEIDHCNGVVI